MQQCIICDELKQEQEGIHLQTLFICTPCEHNIIHTDAREEKYQYYVSKLKNMNQATLHS